MKKLKIRTTLISLRAKPVIFDGELLVDIDYEFGGLHIQPDFACYEESKISISDANANINRYSIKNLWEYLEWNSSSLRRILLTRHQNEIGGVLAG